jgi:hypothetical protein
MMKELLRCLARFEDAHKIKLLLYSNKISKKLCKTLLFYVNMIPFPFIKQSDRASGVHLKRVDLSKHP